MSSGDNMEESTKSKKQVLLEYLRVIVITLIVTYGVLYLVQISRVYGTSMLPTFHEGNIVLVDKVFYKHGEPKRDDIVVVDYKDADQNETYIIKRVIAVGGDHLEIKDNHVYLNGELLEEDYINGTMINNEDMSIDIPEGKIFVMGDNRNNSLDSRRLGYFDFDEDVVGKVFFTVPFF